MVLFKMIKDIFGKNIAVYGVGVTGKACIHYLSEHGIKPLLIDDAPREKISHILDEIDGKYSELYPGDDERDWQALFDRIDTVIISPGIKLPAELDKLASEKNTLIVGEVEFAYRLCKGNIISVTGSNGKSTTVTMIDRILDSAGFISHLVGNIGKAFISVVDKVKPGNWVVLELSSYQLERIDKFKSHIAVLTNIAEDHLARHGDMTGYITAKGRIFENQDVNDHAIINREDSNTWRAFGSAESVLHAFIADEMVNLPSREIINGRDIETFAALNNGVLSLRDRDGITELIKASELQVRGRHNIENALAASIATRLAGVPDRFIISTLRDFKGIEHRIEFLGEFDGVKFFNDSKATNIESTITALKTFEEENLILILGGSEKGSNFESLWTFLRERDDPLTLYLTGPSGKRMSDELISDKWNFDFKLFDTFENCVNSAFRDASEGQSVLLSPGCASFDEFPNFELRGKCFKELLHKFLGVSKS